MPRGLFITLEGLDGSGKTTQIKRLAAWMQKRGWAPVITRQPGGTVLGERIRELLLDSRSRGLSSMAEMALMFADRAQAIAEVIEPALASGKTVLCDRFTCLRRSPTRLDPAPVAVPSAQPPSRPAPQ